MDVRIEFERHRQQRGEGQRHYPAAMQRKAVAYLRERREHGASIEEVAREIGVTKGSLYRWQREPKQTRATRPTLRPVQVMAALKPAAAIVVRGPRGILIEGLDIGGIAELLAKVST